MTISFGEIAGLIAAGAFLLLVIFLAVPLVKLAKTFNSTAKSIEELTEDTKKILKGTSETIDATNAQIEKIDSITSSVAKTVQNIAALSDLYSTALGKPVISAVSSVNGIKNVIKDTSKKVFNKVDDSFENNKTTASLKEKLMSLSGSLADIKEKFSKVPKTADKFKKASEIEDSIKDDYFAAYRQEDKDSNELNDVEKSIIGNVPSFDNVEKEPTKIPDSTPIFESSLKAYNLAMKTTGKKEIDESTITGENKVSDMKEADKKTKTSNDKETDDKPSDDIEKTDKESKEL